MPRLLELGCRTENTCKLIFYINLQVLEFMVAPKRCLRLSQITNYGCPVGADRLSNRLHLSFEDLALLLYV